ncbi:uncharacterized protein [Amphiura filiformis]|uniref:uncharacterized protein n=1 Tax=Amphiura filiformis TaxID=82378 RepID=UPI003B21851B
MEWLEQKAISTAPESCRPRLWKRYVDDVLEIIRKGQVDNLTDHLNTIDPTGSVKFTYEQEQDGSIPFLDTLITRKPDGSVKLRIIARFLLLTHATLCFLPLVDPDHAKAYFQEILPGEIDIEEYAIPFYFSYVGLVSAEYIVTMLVNKGGEWKWFYPSVLLYLLVVVPCIWLLEWQIFYERMEHRHNNSTCNIDDFEELNNRKFLLLMPWINLSEADEEKYGMSAPDWSLALQQIMLFVLILGRWLGPKGEMSRDQLSQLLLVYIGMAADILEFITEGLTNPDIMCNELHEFILLSIWSWSLFQFTLSLTATKNKSSKKSCFSPCLFFETEMWSIVVTTLMQDAPFLSMRLYFMIHSESVNQASLFFTCKNALLLMIQTYRIIIILSIHCKSNAKKNDAEQGQFEDDIDVDLDDSDPKPHVTFWSDLSQTAISLRRFIQTTRINMRFRGRQGSRNNHPDESQETGNVFSVISDAAQHLALQKTTSQAPLCAQPGGEIAIECSMSTADIVESRQGVAGHRRYVSGIETRFRRLFGFSNSNTQEKTKGEDNTQTAEMEDQPNKVVSYQNNQYTEDEFEINESQDNSAYVEDEIDIKL